MHVALSTVARLCRLLPVVCASILALAVVTLPAVVRAQVVSFDGMGTVLPLTGLSNPATLAAPTSVAVDGANNVYVVDYDNSRVVKLTQAGVASVLDTGSLKPPPSSPCSTPLCSPTSVAVDSAGDLYIADSENNRVVEVKAAGVASELKTGSLTAPSTSPCVMTILCSPRGVAVDGAGNVYISDAGNSRWVEVTAAGVASVLNIGTPGGLAIQPAGIAADEAGDLYVVDSVHNRVVEMSAAGAVSVLSTGGLTAPSGSLCSSTALCGPTNVALDSAGDVYIADATNARVVKVTAAGVASVIDTSSLTPPPGSGCSSALCFPQGVGVDSSGDVYIADTSDSRVVEVSQTVNFGNVPVNSAPTANQQTLTYTFSSDDTLTAVNVLTQGALNKDFTADPSSTCVANGQYGPSGADTCTVVVDLSPADPGLRAGAVQLVDANGVQATTYLRAVGQGPLIAFPPGVTSVLSIGSLTGGFASYGCSITGICDPLATAADSAGDVYIADFANNRVVEVKAAGATNVLSLNGLSGGTTIGGCSSTGLCGPSGVAVDGAGDVYIADTTNNRVVEVTAAGVASVLSTGSLAAGSGCGTTLCAPLGLALDGAGNVYIADTGANRVVEVQAAGAASVLRLAGLAGGITYGVCSATGVCYPAGVAVDGAGDVYIADQYNGRVVEVTAGGAASVLSTGSLAAGSECVTALCGPSGVAVDSAGDVYIADQYNSRVVEVTAAGVAGVLSTANLAGTIDGSKYYGCPGTGLCVPASLAVDGAGDVYIADSGNNRVVVVNQEQAAPLTFAATSDGDTSSDSPQNVSLQNIGNQPLIFSSVTTATTGQTADSFNLNGATTCSGSTSLNGGESCGLGVEFEPLATGPLSGTVSITDNNLYSTSPAVTTQQIALVGTGIGYAANIGLQESATTVNFGTGVSVTATLSGANGVPTGSVSYSVDGVTLGTTPLTAGATTSSAQINLPATLDADMHGVEVTYAGDANYPEPSSAGFSLTVNPDTTATTLSAPSATTAGSSVDLTATVLSGSTPVTSGTVTFASGALSIGAAQLGAGGTATLATTVLPAGSDSVTASFAGTQDYAASTSPGSTVVVSAAGTTTSLSAPSSAVAGSSVNLTATVMAGSTPMTRGMVNFSSTNSGVTVSLGAAPLGAGGTATLTTTTLPMGNDSVTATFTGTQDYAGSTSSGSAVVVSAAGTTTSLSAPSSAVAGSSVNLQATVLAGSTPVTSGTVTFSTTVSGVTVSLGAASLGSGGTATLATTALPVGSNSVTATFAGTTDYAPSTSSSSTVAVSALIAPSYSISASPTALSISQGSTGSTTLTFTPVGGYTGTVVLSCGNLPSYVTCAFTQNGAANSTVTMSGNNQPVTVTLTINTNVSTARLNALPGVQPNVPQSPAAPLLTAMVFWLPGGMTGLVALGRRRKTTGKNRRLPLCLIGAAALALAAGLSACAGSGWVMVVGGTGTTTTPAGASTVTVTATPSTGSNPSSSSQTLTLHLTITA